MCPVKKLKNHQKVLVNKCISLIDGIYRNLFLATPEEIAAKKTRVKQSLMKRARSVAIFSLKLKERRAREAQEKTGTTTKPPITPTAPLPPPQCGGGELSCIPIEKLIQLEDLKRNAQKANQSGTL